MYTHTHTDVYILFTRTYLNYNEKKGGNKEKGKRKLLQLLFSKYILTQGIDEVCYIMIKCSICQEEIGILNTST